MKCMLFLTSTLMLSAAAPAIAQDKPLSMVGTWLVEGQAVGVGRSFHPAHSNDDPEPTVHRVNLRFVFEKQEGNSFWGTSTGGSGDTERIVGALSGDGKSGVLVNARGNQQVLRIVDDNTVEGCYAASEANHVSAACSIWRRQR